MPTLDTVRHLVATPYPARNPAAAALMHRPMGVVRRTKNIRNAYVLYNLTMGIVKISDQMHENLRVASNALSRSINAQAEHWMRVGMLAELHPDLDHREICQLLIRAEQAGGFDLATVAAALATASGHSGRRVQ